MARFTSNRQIVCAPRRARQWAQRITNGSIVAATHAGIGAVNLLSELEVDLSVEMHNVTISALNINVTFRLTSSTTGDDTSVTTAIALVGEDAFTVGGVALPDPFTDHADWMFWDSRTMTSSRDVTDVDEVVINGFLEIRNKSMRKMRENHQVLALLVRCSLLQPVSLQFFVAGRSLVLLP